ncbi:hypothetical protein A2154_00905 [Candidatus Gottesmanbacteria bacterium RBG_16_43_7]|uniref:Metal-dependent hydrolase n=1 Tax=Candidatus Gottesmanbacteria bacterium RBG_16_43_7 TaxID=1798373 RepID=A0A1F5ZA09_9BACT|nr:MAG: hypothetical protein A2154_00905 [Candidatus Gottesmanbacteria bacterium RBG_16_43_7]
MITGGHIAVSYLLAESAKSLGIHLTNNEVIGIIIAGNITDIDFFAGFLNGKTGEAHHQNITHTPFGILLIWGVMNLVFHPISYVSLLLLLSLLIHLILDDVGYWAYRTGIYKLAVNPQVNWLYPFTQFHKQPLITSNKVVLRNYIFKAWPIALAEGILIVLAIIIFIVRNLT